MKFLCNSLILLPLLVGGDFLWAASASSSTLKLDSQAVKKRKSPLSVDLALTYNALSSQEDQEVIGNQYFGDISILYKTAKTSSSRSKIFDLQARMNNAENLMFSMREAYIDMYPMDGLELSLGRKVIDWSELDRRWGFGATNNRMNFDLINPGEEGLSGLFTQYKSKNFSATLFLSPLYIPELNPGQEVNEDQGTVKCRNPWCRPLADSIEITEGVNRPFFYNVNYPNPEDIVFRSSAGLNLSFENQISSRHFIKASVSGLRKPENTLSTSAEVIYQNEFQRVFVDVFPEVYYHTVTAASIDYRFQGSDTSALYANVSLLDVNVETRPDTEEPYIRFTGIKPKKIDESYMGGHIGLETRFIQFEASYIARTSEYDLEDDVLSLYPRWSQVIGADILIKPYDALTIKVSAKEDAITTERIGEFEVALQASPNARFSIGAQTIGSDQTIDRSYWNQFVNNDLFFTRVRLRL